MSDHVGIEESSNRNTVAVIEGNGGGEVQRLSYVVTKERIMETFFHSLICEEPTAFHKLTTIVANLQKSVHTLYRNGL